MRISTTACLAALLLLCGATSVPAQQAGGADQDESLSVVPGRLSVERMAGELERLRQQLSGLSAGARDAAEDIALVVHDDYRISEDRVIPGSLALLGGELDLDGRVEGDILVLDGVVLLNPSARVEGDVLQVGGQVEHLGGRVGGELLSVRAVEPQTDAGPESPEEERVRSSRAERSGPGFFVRLLRNLGRALSGVLGVAGTVLVLGLAGAVVVYFLRPRLEAVADTAREHFGRSFGVGFLAQILIFPVALVLTVGVITIPLLLLYVPAVILALLGGYLAAAHAAGEALAHRRFRYEWIERVRRSNSYYYLLSGLVALLLPFALAEALHLFGGWLGFFRGLIHFIGVVGNWVALTAGLGAVLLARAGSQPRPTSGRSGPETARPGSERPPPEATP